MTPTIEIEVKNLDFYYNGNIHALKEISLPIHKNKVTALIGPSGCGKTTLLRCFNRMHDLYPKHRYEGEILFQDRNILADDIDLINLRSRIGMVFQKPTPFPMSIAENIAYGLRLKGIRNKIGARRADRRGAQACRALGRGPGQAERQRLRSLRRTAAAARHRAGPGR